ncbi:hypothetical protein GCM10009001_08230 [Virgibacillus siamensis]|uniref:Uncharacterized protein n=1 Tax=Virgibacillus siamensis TaxID=480071 RepID=A0ABP3QNQ7_9BACI
MQRRIELKRKRQNKEEKITGTFDRKLDNWLLDVSKVLQYLELEKYGIRTPRTVAAVGKDEMLQAAEKFNGKKFITKHNRAGKGLGVQLFNSMDALNSYIKGDSFEESVDGITLLQGYIESPV